MAKITRRQFHAGVAGAAGAATLTNVAGPAIAQRRGGDVIIAQQAAPPTLDGQTSSAQASRNVSLHIWETLLARDENANVKPDLAESFEVSPDGLTYTFRLRSGVKFHNGKDMTSADAKASFERYGRVGASAFIMRPVRAIETPDARTVIVRLSSVYPGFLEGISSPRAPVAVMPSEEAAKGANEIAFIGTGPYQFVEFRPDSHVRLRRYDGYTPNTNYQGRDGFAGKKTPYFDTVTFRFMPEAGARTAALQTGEVHVLEALAIPAAQRLRDSRDMRAYEMMPWAIQTFMLNMSQPPLDNLMVRRAIQATLDMEEIMAISNDGLYRLLHGWQHPDTTYFAGDVGRDKYNIKNPALGRQLLQQSGYANQEIVFLADSNFTNHKQSAEVAAEQLRRIGLNIRLDITDWPTAFARRQQRTGWHMWALLMGIEPYEGPYNVVGFFAGADAQQKVQDPGIEDAQRRLTTSVQLADRQAAVRDFQARMYDQAIAIKCGDVGIFQATRANLMNYAPYRIPRMWDCWFA